MQTQDVNQNEGTFRAFSAIERHFLLNNKLHLKINDANAVRYCDGKILEIPLDTECQQISESTVYLHKDPLTYVGVPAGKTFQQSGVSYLVLEDERGFINLDTRELVNSLEPVEVEFTHACTVKYDG